MKHTTRDVILTLIVATIVSTPFGVALDILLFKYIAYVFIFGYIGLMTVGAIFVFTANFMIWWNGG